MIDFIGRLGAATIPILTSITTVAVLTLLRLLAPTVRWRRRLKQDTDILNPLPVGAEKEFWAASVEAQAIRLRLYFDANTRFDRTLEWVIFAVFLNVALLALFEVNVANTGIIVQLTAAEWPAFVISVLVCLYAVVQLVRGFPIVPRRSQAAKEYLAVRRSFKEHTEQVYVARREATAKAEADAAAKAEADAAAKAEAARAADVAPRPRRLLRRW